MLVVRFVLLWLRFNWFALRLSRTWCDGQARRAKKENWSENYKKRKSLPSCWKENCRQLSQTPRQVRIAELEKCTLNREAGQKRGEARREELQQLLTRNPVGPARRLGQVSTLCGCNCGVKVKYFRQGLSLLRLDTPSASSCLRLFRRTIGERQAQKQRQWQKRKRKQLCQAFLPLPILLQKTRDNIPHRFAVNSH